jgi:hypothetical protein
MPFLQGRKASVGPMGPQAHWLSSSKDHNERRLLALVVTTTISLLTLTGEATPLNAAVSTGFTIAAPAPNGEDAYCDKGNVAKFGEKDGPAALPKTCYYTGLDGTASPGRQIRVGANQELIGAVEGARCGDTLFLAAGATYGMKAFPAKHCDDHHYITVRTDTPDSKLPPKSSRISPAWAGETSLPGRPPFAKPSGGPGKLMATIIVRSENGVEFGDHYRFVGIEWVPLLHRKIGALLFTNGGHHLIFDRNWVHGNDGTELGHGLIIKGSTYIAVVHSYFSGFTCTAKTGSCTDAAAIGGGNGDNPTATLKIFDNYLESSGENIFFGGGPAAIRPEDIEIRRNYLFKPMFWNPNSQDHREPTPIVKNLFELKNASRVLFEANYLENSWGGFSQVGPAILLTPRNNFNKHLGIVTCPDCAVTDVTIRYIWIRKVNQVLQIANIMDQIKPAPGNSYSIHDIVAEGLGYPECGKACSGMMNQIAGAPGGSPKESVMHDVAVDHITYVSVVRPKDLLIMGGPPANDPHTPQMYNITFTNSIADVGIFGIWFTGGTPEKNCANFQRATPKTRIEACWKTGSAFKGNVLAGGNAIRGQTTEWPEGNSIAESVESVGFVNLNRGLDGDYHLSAASKFKGKATDGRDPGADIDLVLKAVQGVR